MFAFLASQGTTMIRKGSTGAPPVPHSTSLHIPAAQYALPAPSTRTHLTTSYASTALLIRRAHHRNLPIAVRDTCIIRAAAYRVLKDCTTYRTPPQRWRGMVLAILVSLGPSLMKKHRLSARAVLQARSLLVTRAQSAQAVLRHRTQSMALPASMLPHRQAHRHVDTQQDLLLCLQLYSFAMQDMKVTELVASLAFQVITGPLGYACSVQQGPLAAGKHQQNASHVPRGSLLILVCSCANTALRYRTQSMASPVSMPSCWQALR